MAENSKIEWTDHTFSPWTGCTKVSPGCDHCYAEGWSKRSGHVQWGPHGERRRTSAANWRKPLKWNAEAARTGIRRKVFCASLADVFDNHKSILPSWRADLFHLIHQTPHLDWLLLTKRPQNIQRFMPNYTHTQREWPNVWLGTTVENQTEADRRIPHLLAVPAAVRFLSVEPMLAPVDIRHFFKYDPVHEKQAKRDICVSISPERGLGNPAGRNNLAASETGLGSLEEQGRQQAVQADQGGARQRGVFPSEGDDRRSPRLGSSASVGVASLSRADTGRDHREPQRWAEEKQPPFKSGTGDLSGATTSCDTRSEGGSCRGSAWAAQQHGASDHGTGADHSRAATGGRGSVDHSSGFRDRVSNGIEDCERGSSINLVIVGGESGPGARPMHPDWARSLRDQCQAAGVAFHFKQWGEWAPAIGMAVTHRWDGNALQRFDGGRVDGPGMARIGKARAGRLLDGCEWNEMPRRDAVQDRG